MKISRKRSSSGARNWPWAGILFVFFALGLLIGQQGLLDQLAAVPSDLAKSLRSRAAAGVLPTLTVDMAFADYDVILGQRSEALDTGVYIGGEEDFIPATIRVKDGDDEQQATVRMRLVQGPAASLGPGEKWGFEVRTRNDALLLDMGRFTLQDPGANNWLNQWAFAQTLQDEGILTARYHLVNLIFNGDERGIYAVQEGFGDELLLAQGKPAGVIVEYAPERLWETIRLHEGDLGAVLADPVANLSGSDAQFFEVDTFRDAQLARDAKLSAQKDAAISLLREFQAGDVTAGQLFDLESYGTFLALVDLWGAMDALTLTNLRYFYNAESGRLTPIAYNSNPLSSNERISPAAFYDDPDLQVAYAQAVQRISHPEYLDQMRDLLEPEIEEIQAAINGEFEQELPWQTLQERQAQMRRSLSPVQPLFGYLSPTSLSANGFIQADVANILNLPVEVVGFDIDGATFLEVRPDMIQGDPGELLISAEDGSVVLRSASNRQPALRFVRFHLSLAEIQLLDDELGYQEELNIYIATRIPGQEGTQLTLLRPGFADPVSPPG